MDVPELLRRAVDLIPGHARSDAGLSADDVRDLLRIDDWEMALDVLADFDHAVWQTTEYWRTLADVARMMWLERTERWCHWCAAEVRHGLIRADLQLVPAETGPGRAPIAGDGRLRPMWAFDGPDGAESRLHIATLWVEFAPYLEPGGRATVRLSPLSPELWWHLRPGGTITMHEARPPAGTATIIEIHPPSAPCAGADA